MINTLEQRKWSCLQEDRRPIMPGVSGQAFRCWRVWYGGVSLAYPVSGATCYRERLSEEIKSAADSLSWSLP